MQRWPTVFGPGVKSGSKEESFSNMNPTTPVEIEGMRFPSAEAAYHALKSSDPAFRQRMAETKSPFEALRLSKSQPKLSVREREAIMRRVQAARFVQNSHFREQLMATGEEELREIGPAPWGGEENLMGRILMDLREWGRGPR